MTKTKLKQPLGETLRESWRALSTLVKMQLKEKMDLSYLRSTRALIFKLVWLIIEFAAITAVLTVLFNYVKLLGLFSLVHDIPVSVISLIFAVMLLLSVITDTAGLMKSLYFSKDNTVLLTFPATPSLVFFSKLAVYYVYELRKSFMFTIPMFIAFGIAKGYNPYYYPWLLLMFGLITVVPVLLSALLSIPAMYIYVFLNRVRVLQYILYASAGAVAILLVYSLIGLIPENINFIETWGETYWEIQSFLNSYVKSFAAIYAFTELIVGRTVGITSYVFHSGTLPTLLVVIALALVLLALCFVCSKPLFCRMAATPFEFKKKNAARARKNKQHSPFLSALKKEWTSGLRSNYFIKLGGILIVIMPMAIYLLNKLYSAMNTRYLGTQMTVCFNVMIMLLILLMTNIDIASVYSRDGASSYLNKVQPAPYALLLYSKLFFPMVIAFVGTLVTTSVFHAYSALSTVDNLMLGVTVYTVYVAHLFSSAESDIMNPQHKQYATFNEQSGNPNESGAAILAVLLSAVVFLVGLFFSSSSTAGVWTRIGIVTTVAAVFKVITYLSKIKAFYKEKM
ncbi:MAG: hypothetical protein IJW53_06050 [Clostridia bacterium]|nr:hypothetical protein [Clostridia bacterium]